MKGNGKGHDNGKDKSKGKGKGPAKGKDGCKGASATPGASASGSASGGAEVSGPCKFFGSAKGCDNEACSFSHDAPNSVPPCSFKQRLGHCERGEACTYRHVPWSSAEEARRHYAKREKGVVELTMQRYKQLHRDQAGASAIAAASAAADGGRHGGKEVALAAKLKPEHLELQVEQEMQLETYGSTAMRMMEKMGYSAGSGLGKESQGRKTLVGPALELERNSQQTALGLGHYTGSARSTVAERSARLADARAQKHRRLDEAGFTQHNLLSSDESSEGEQDHRKARDIHLKAKRES